MAGVDLFPEEAVASFLEAVAAAGAVSGEETLVALYSRLVELGWRIGAIAETAGARFPDRHALDEFTSLLSGELSAYVGIASALARLAADAHEVSPTETLARAERALATGAAR